MGTSELYRVVLALDVATWFAPLILFASVDRGPANARLWLSIMLVMKIALLLGILARAIMRQRIGDARKSARQFQKFPATKQPSQRCCID